MFPWETQTSLENPLKCTWGIKILAPSKFSHSLEIGKRKKILLEIPIFSKVSYYFPIFQLHVSLSKSMFFNSDLFHPILEQNITILGKPS